MRRKVLQQFANMFPQRFLDLPQSEDLAAFVRLGSGVVVADFLSGRSRHGSTEFGPLRLCADYREWLQRECARHHVAIHGIVCARMRIHFAVSDVTARESFGHVLRWATFDFDCESEVATDERAYLSRLSAKKTWGYREKHDA